MAKRWMKTTKSGLTMVVEKLDSGKWLGQLTGKETVETGHCLHNTDTDYILSHFETLEAALNAVGYPYDLAGIPKQLL